jgi:hypothetical protein
MTGSARHPRHRQRPDRQALAVDPRRAAELIARAATANPAAVRKRQRRCRAAEHLDIAQALQDP